MASLTGQKIKDTYQSLLKVGDNGQITSVSKSITDGVGNTSGLFLKSDGVTISGSLTVEGIINATSSYAISASYAQKTADFVFSRTRTPINDTTTVFEYQALFNPADLLVQSSSIFIVEQNAQYYVLGDLTNSGSIQVDGEIKVDGGLYNYGAITGTGIIY